MGFALPYGMWVMYVGLVWDGKGLVILRQGGVIVAVNGCWWWCYVESGFRWSSEGEGRSVVGVRV